MNGLHNQVVQGHNRIRGEFFNNLLFLLVCGRMGTFRSQNCFRAFHEILNALALILQYFASDGTFLFIGKPLIL
jgi:hypothetical protein